MILGYSFRDYIDCNIKVPVTISLPYKTSNILITGKSGSGKSLSTLYYVWNLLHTKESICYIADYKGGEEYQRFEGSLSYASGEKAIDMINDYYEYFSLIRNNKIRLQSHVSLIIEEWLGLLTYAETKDKKLKSELMRKVGEILSVARGLNLGIILCIQRPDSTNFSAGSRDQFQAVVSFGRCSNEHFRMLGFSNELEHNPTQGYKAGQALALIDGQDNIFEIIVPLIKNPEQMCQGIRNYLDLQQDIHSLIQTITESKSLN